MTIPQNRYPANSTQYIFFATYGGLGQSITMTGFAVTDIEIYKNGSTTQRASDNGVALLDTDGTDFDGLTGIHGFSIDLSDNSDASFYAVGSKYTVVVSTVTVDGQTISFIADRFEIVAAESIAGKPKVDVDAWLGTAAATPTVAGVPEVDLTHWLGTAAQGASGRPEVDVELWLGSAPNALTSGRVDVIVNAMAAGVITASVIANAAIDAATFAADVDAEILSYMVDDATRIDASALNTLSGHDPGETIMGATDLGTGAGLTSLATQASVNTIDDFLDTEVAAILAAVDTEIGDIIAAIAALPTANANADALLDRANGIETGITLRQAMRGFSAALLGKLSGAGTGTEVMRDATDAKDRITATTDDDGNRTAITLDLT